MRSVNKVILIGNLTRDPELKSTTGGQSIVTFGLATNRQWTTSDGEKRSSAEFHECVAWAKLAEICKDYIKKGMLVYVEGYLKTRSWDMEDGTRRFRTEVVLHDMIILEKRGDRDEDYTPTGDDVDISDDSNMGSDSGSTTGDNDDDAAAPVAEEATSETPAEEPAAPAVEEAPAPEEAAGEIKADIDDDDMF